MFFVLQTANVTADAKNCLYPNRKEITGGDELKSAVRFDHVCGEFKKNYRNISNFLKSNVIVMDCDNDHSDDPEDWITFEKLEELFEEIDYAAVPSRNHMKEKDGKAARPKFHVFFPHKKMTAITEVEELKRSIHAAFPFFDSNCLDGARFLYGSVVKPEDIIWHEGDTDIDEYIKKLDAMTGTQYTIPQGRRNATMSHFAGKVVKRFGTGDDAKKIFMDENEKCDPPLSDEEIEKILNILYKKAGLEESYSVNMNCIYKKKPEVMGLKRILETYTEYKWEVYTSKYQKLLADQKDVREIKSGLLEAVDVIDLIIEILRGSKTTKEAKECLMYGKTDNIKFRYKGSIADAKQFSFTEKQTDAILAMRLQKLIGLEVDVLKKELEDAEKKIAKYDKLLKSNAAMKFEKNQDVVRKFDVNCKSDDRIAIFDSEGMVHIIKVSDILKKQNKKDKKFRITDKGIQIFDFCGMSHTADVVAMMNVSEMNLAGNLVFVTTEGKAKRANAALFDTSRKTSQAIKAGVVYVGYESEYIVAVTENGYSIKVKAEEIPVQGKGAGGVQLISLRRGDHVVNAISAGNDAEFNGISLSNMKAVKRGGKGNKK